MDEDGNEHLLFGAPAIVGATGARLFFNKIKAVFRVGSTTGTTRWLDSNIGVKSTVTGGHDNEARAECSTVGGGQLNKAGGGTFGNDNTEGVCSTVTGVRVIKIEIITAL
uniref:Uncharacterized protein n=1 Tax=Pithovirus LCDPAC01 TaxID=2506600 RepID=A0A481YN21_9VIRU|nr:MAG: hypothetical protein LCDPAC01_01600 [Pithovirus LCDPAC01]